ncbi:hypothetical protein ABIQ69_04125 [Agromyces sp. G08B096]|uniref:Uncharacterized protein n=1 Tax=Agromyces sp. G08B096 TaxID=3156399 RepID=A0AAU7W8D2_9MICO
MSRGARLTALAVALPLAWAALALPAAADDALPEPPGGADVEVPYLESVKIEPAPPWRIADCAVPLAAGPLVTSCDETGLTLAAPDYDPEAGIIVVPVPLTDGSVSMTVSYRAHLAPPPAPALAPAATARPVAAGSLLRVPLSELGLTCTRCGEGIRVRAGAIDPSRAGSAWATPTHLVFRAASDFTGPAELSIRVVDEFGSSTEATIPIGVYRAGPDPLIALDVFAPIGADGTAEIDLGQLASSLGDADVAFVGCGRAIHGSVSCDPDGRAHYAGGGAVDQFGFLVTADGEQAAGSITLVPEASDLPDGGPVPVAPVGDGEEPTLTVFVPPPPVEHTDRGGAFDPLIAVLDRVGAR